MAVGYQLGSTCYQTLQQLGARACADAVGLVSSGHQSCAGFITQHNAVILDMAIAGNGHVRNYQSTVIAQPCEYPTFNDTYAPLLAVTLPVFVLIFIGRRILDMFKTDQANV